MEPFRHCPALLGTAGQMPGGALALFQHCPALLGTAGQLLLSAQRAGEADIAEHGEILGQTYRMVEGQQTLRENRT